MARFLTRPDLINLENQRITRRRIFEYIRDRFKNERDGQAVWWNQALANVTDIIQRYNLPRNDVIIHEAVVILKLAAAKM